MDVYLINAINKELQTVSTIDAVQLSQLQTQFQELIDLEDYKSLRKLLGRCNQTYGVKWNGSVLDYLDGLETTTVVVREEGESRVSTPLAESIYKKLVPGGQIVTVNKKLDFLDIKKLIYQATNRRFHEFENESLESIRRKMFLPFILSPNYEVNGNILIQFGETKKSVVLGAYSISQGNLVYKTFGDQATNKMQEVFSGSFYQYQFLTDQNKKLMVFSQEELDIGSHYSIIGMLVDVRDETKIGEYVKVPTELQCLFIMKADKTIQEIDLVEFHSRAMDYTHDKLAEKVFGKYRQPEWFEKFIFAWLFGGSVNGFPLHILWVGPTGSGKTTGVLDPISDAFGEGVYDGTVGTLKSIVPHFGGVSAEVGYLSTTRRVALIDEFFQLLRRNAVQGKDHTENEAGLLTSLLEHKEHIGGSGKHEAIKSKMRSRVLAATNPRYGLKNMQECTEVLPNQMMSRFIWYFQTQQHFDFIQERKLDFMSQTREELAPRYDPKFIEMIDFMQSFVVHVDKHKVAEIYDKYKEMLPLGAEPVYAGRSHHHIMCLLDGIVKYNCIVEHRLHFDVMEKDIQEADELFGLLISTWNENVDFTKLPIRIRLQYISISIRSIYDLIEKNRGCTARELEKLANRQVAYPMEQLRKLQLIKEEDGKREDRDVVEIYPFWYDKSIQDIEHA